MNLAGRHITSHLVKLLFMRGYAFNSSADFELIRDIKEKMCFVSGDIELDRKLANETTYHEKQYRLPDGSKINIGRERFEASEILFNPQFAGHDFSGLSDMTFNAINESPMDTRKDLYENIFISGGTSMLPGFPTRLTNDIRRIYSQTLLKTSDESKIKLKITVHDPPRRRFNVFIGAGIVAETFRHNPDAWISI